MKIFRVFLILASLGSLSITMAQMKTGRGPASLHHLRLQDLGVNSQDSVRVRALGRSVASSDDVVTPNSRAMMYAYSACWGPYGQRYSISSPQYNECLNNELTIQQGRGVLGGKALGLGILFAP